MFALEKQVAKLSKLEEGQIPFQAICEEAKINYENLESLSYSRKLSSNFQTIDTLTVFEPTWKQGVRNNEIEKDREKLYNWLKYKLQLDTLVVK